MNINRTIAEWAGWRRKDDKGEWWSVPGTGRCPEPPASNMIITLWHSTLFPLIKNKKLQVDFIIELANELGLESNAWSFDLLAGGWELVTAAPAQLAEALVRVIKEAG